MAILSFHYILHTMEKLELQKDPGTPYVLFDPDTGKLKVEGRSIPENPGIFYDQLIDWLKEYFKNPKQLTVLEFNLEYVNSGSSKLILTILRLLQDESAKGHDIIINWFYEEDDESILTLGEHYKGSLNLPFNLIEYI